MVQSVNKYFLEIPAPLAEFIISDSGFKFYLGGAKYNHNWNVTVNGKLALKPKSGLPINVGDEVAFNYRVCNERNWDVSTDEVFHILLDEEGYREWYNGNGEVLKMEKNPFLSNEWNCCVIDGKGDLLDVYCGRYGDCENWISKFKFNNENYTYKNLVPIDDKDYWKADETEIYASITDGKLVAHNDYCIINPIKEDLTKRAELQKGIILTDKKILSIPNDRGVVVASANNEFEPGTVVGFVPEFCEKYDLWGKKQFLVKNRNIEVAYK